MHTDFSIEVSDFLNNHPRSKLVEYDPVPHTYFRFWDDKDPEQYYGVTSLLKNYAPFDATSIKHGIVNSKKPEYAHLNTVAEVEAEWKAARDYGSMIHDDLDYSVQTGEVPEHEVAEEALLFLLEQELTPIGSEYVVFCDELKRATPIDIPLVNKHNQIVIGDWKTSKEIKASHYVYNGKKKKMEYPLNHLPNSNFWQYSLQIALSRHWLETYYDCPFEIAPYGYIFHIRDGKFTAHKTMPMKREIDMIYEWESKVN